MDQTKDDASLIIASGAQQMALAEHSSGSTGTGRSPAGSGLYSSLAVLSSTGNASATASGEARSPVVPALRVSRVTEARRARQPCNLAATCACACTRADAMSCAVLRRRGQCDWLIGCASRSARLISLQQWAHNFQRRAMQAVTWLPTSNGGNVGTAMRWAAACRPYRTARFQCHCVHAGATYK
jgi:hypothetical protein